MNIREKIHRLVEYMNIPVIDDTLLLKIREWEILFEPELKEFRSFRQRFGLIMAELFNEPLKTLQELKNVHAFKFIKASQPGKQLTGSWTLDIIRPPIEEDQHAGVFQTEEFLRMLEESPPAPQFLRKIVESQNNNGKPTPEYKIWLQKVSANVATGMISFHDHNDGYFPFLSQDAGNNITNKKLVEQKIIENMYLELFRFMEENPDARDQIFFFFRNVVKPNALLKEKMPEATL
jgi:hypothetical protein